MSTKYEVIIYWSEADDAYIAVVPDLPGCMTHGDTREDAVLMAEEAIDAWLQVAREFGRAIPEPTQRALAHV